MDIQLPSCFHCNRPYSATFSLATDPKLFCTRACEACALDATAYHAQYQCGEWSKANSQALLEEATQLVEKGR